MPTISLLHGSTKKFSCFEKTEDARFDTGQHILGFYFTDDQDTAESYAYLWPREIADILGIDEDDVTEDDIETENSNIDHFLYTAEIAYSSMKTYDYDPYSLMSKIEEMQLDFNEGNFNKFLDSIKSEGHDLIEFKTADGYSEYVVLNKDQISITDCKILSAKLPTPQPTF